MYTSEELRALAKAYLEANPRVSRTGLSLQITGAKNSSEGHGKLIIRLLDGKDCLMMHGELMSRWFEENWPPGTPWPDEVRRDGTECNAQVNGAAE
jgi:hypothetical protein